MDFLIDYYPWIKALHVMSIISWMAGLLYLPRLFVYHSQENGKNLVTEKFKVMERRLYKAIMNPAMMSSWFFGLLLLFTPGIIDFTTDYWFHIKLLSVIFMSVIHFYLGSINKKFANDINIKNHKYYRILNEIPTLLMIVIVIMVIVRPFSG
jgi:putative membrane protein